MDDNTVELARRQARICRIFSNPSRVMIMWALYSGELTVGDIAAAAHSSLQNTSQHLRLMKDKGILASRREGSSVYYRVQPHEDLEGCRIMELASMIEKSQPEEASNLTSIYE